MGLSLRGTTSGAVDINAPAVAGDNTITLPGTNGAANQFYKNSGTAGIVTHSSMVEESNGSNIGIGTDTFTAASSGRQIVEIGGVSGSLINLDVGGARKAYHFTDGTDVYSYNTASGSYIFGTNNTEKVRIDSSGRVMIQNTAAGSLNAAADDLVVGSGSASGGITVYTGSSDQGALYFADGTNGTEPYVGGINYGHSDNQLRFLSNGSTYMRLDSSGRLLLGTATSPTAGNGQYANIVVQGYPNTPTGAGHISLQRGQAAFGANNQIGLINFGDNTGASYAGIECYADADSGANDFPGRLVFSTTADGAASPTERLRIDSSGRVFIGSISTPSSTSADDLVIAGTGNRGITINSTDSNESSIFFADGTSGSAQYEGQVAYFHSTNTMALATAGSYRLYINSDGNVGINDNNPQAKLNVTGNTLVDSQIILVENLGAGSGPSAPSAGIAVTSFAHNNATAGYGIDIFSQHGIGQDTYGLRAKAMLGSSSTACIGVLGHTHVNSGSTNHSPSLPDGGVVAGVYGYATNYGETNIAQSSAVIGWNNCTYGALAYGGYFRTTPGPTSIIPLLINHDGTDLLKVDSNGQIQIGRSSPVGDEALALQNTTGKCAYVFQGANSNYNCMELRNAYATGGQTAQMIKFAQSNGGQVGQITSDATSTSYLSGASDSRLKKNIEDWNEDILQHFKTLNPRKFNYLIEEDGDPKTKGYIAQDLAAAFPEAYPNLYDEDADDNRYSYNPGGMVVYLMKALQEEIVKREALETQTADLLARVTALEG